MEQRSVPKNEHTQNIRAGLSVLKTNYSLSIDEYDYLDIAVDLLRDVRYFGSTDYVLYTKANEKGHVKIPCNLDEIHAITTAEMAKNVFKGRVEVMDEGSNINDDLLKREAIASALGFVAKAGIVTPGSHGYIDYSLDTAHNRISVGEKYANSSIAIAYSGVATDLEGFPLITRKQANAIAAVCAKIITMRAANRGDRVAATLLEMYMGLSARLVQAASMPESLSDNDIDELLDAKTSFNRKSINRPTRYRR